MLKSEKPDLVVFTGDNIDGTGGNVFLSYWMELKCFIVFEPVNGGKANLTLTGVNDARAATLKYSQPVIEQKIPWVRIDVSRIL